MSGMVNQKEWRSRWNDGAPPPRPIPILYGNPGPNDDLMLTIRVVRFERPLVGYQQILMNRPSRDSEMFDQIFESEFDRGIRACLLEVGKDSGVWVAHVTPWRWMGYSERPALGIVEPEQVWAPPISREIYRLAEKRALRQPDTPLTVSGFDFDPAEYYMDR